MSSLPAIAAVHVLLAGHPELAALPLTWQVDPDGTITAKPEFRALGSCAAVQALAAVLGAQTEEYEAVLEGAPIRVVRLLYGATLDGFPISSDGYEQVTA